MIGGTGINEFDRHGVLWDVGKCGSLSRSGGPTVARVIASEPLVIVSVISVSVSVIVIVMGGIHVKFPHG